MKVYVLTRGEYSDYHIIGVYSTSEKAQEMCDAMRTSWDEPQIEEYELDERNPSMGYVYIGYAPKHNKVHQYGFSFVPGPDMISPYIEPPELLCYLPYSTRLSDPSVLLKAAQDHYIKWKAEQELI